MRKDKIKAYQLRREGKSYSSISRTLGIPKSTLSDWFIDEDWSRKIRDALGAQESLTNPKKLSRMSRAAKERWVQWRKNHREKAEQEFSNLKDDPLFIAGIMLYWGEGNKSSKNQVRFTNSEPMMIRVFCNFLSGSLQVPAEKIKAYLILYPDLKDEMQKRFWSRATSIPMEQFTKSVYIKGRHPTRRLSYGICNVSISSGELKEKIMTWINLYQKLLA